MFKKKRIKYEIKKNRKRKQFNILAILTIISILLGIMFVAILSKNDKNLIKNSFDSYFQTIAKSNYNGYNTIINNILSNVLLPLLIWIMGVSLIATPISILYLLYKSFIYGFTISSLIYTYGFKVIPILLIYIFSLTIDLFIIFILTFYAINLSRKIYIFIFKKKDININITFKTYSKFLIIMLAILLISAYFNAYIAPILIKSFTKLII